LACAFGRGPRDADLLDLHGALRLGDLGVRGDEALAVVVGEVDVELPHLEDADADVARSGACATNACASFWVSATH
jgi:hypothetical protein